MCLDIPTASPQQSHEGSTSGNILWCLCLDHCKQCIFLNCRGQSLAHLEGIWVCIKASIRSSQQAEFKQVAVTCRQRERFIYILYTSFCVRVLSVHVPMTIGLSSYITVQNLIIILKRCWKKSSSSESECIIPGEKHDIVTKRLFLQRSTKNW